MLYLQEVFIIVLQFNYVVVCVFGEGFVFVIVFFCFVIEIFEVGQGYFVGVFLLLFFQICDQYFELGVLVVDVVGVDYFMIQEFQGMD